MTEFRKKIRLDMPTRIVVAGVIFLFVEIYSHVIYLAGFPSLAIPRLAEPSTRLNLSVFLLGYLLILYGVFLKKKKDSVLLLLSLAFGGFLLFWEIFHPQFYMGSLFFDFPPTGFSRISVWISAFLSICIVRNIVEARWRRLGQQSKYVVEYWLAAAIMAWVFARTYSLIAAAWPFTTDDAYITLRYARHFAEGHGIVWNIGEPPVEGYSNFSFLLLAAGCIKAGWDPVPVLKVLNCATLGGTCLALFYISRRWVGPVAATLPAIFLTAYEGTIWWTVSGMETATYQFLVVSSIALFFRALRWDCVGPDASESAGVSGEESGYRLPSLSLAAAFSFLASLTHPEGPVVFLPMAAVLAFRLMTQWLRRRDNVAARRELQALVVFVACFATAYIVYFGWRWSYFDSLLPNSVLVKANSHNPTRLIRDFWVLSAPFIILSLFQPLKRLDAKYVPLWGIPLIYCIIMYGVNPIVAYMNRHFLAAFALLLAPASAGLIRISGFFDPYASGWKREIAVVLCVVAVMGALDKDVGQPLALRAQRYALRMENRSSMGAWIDRQLEDDEWYVMGDAGIAPYVSRCKVLDSYGLNCREFTHPPINRSWRAFADYIIQKQPSMIVIASKDPKRLVHRATINKFMMAHPEFEEQYNYVKTFAIPSKPDAFNYFVYQRAP